MSTLAGVFTLADGLAYQEKLVKDPDFSPDFSELVDCTNVTKMDKSGIAGSAESVTKLALIAHCESNNGKKRFSVHSTAMQEVAESCSEWCQVPVPNRDNKCQPLRDEEATWPKYSARRDHLYH